MFFSLILACLIRLTPAEVERVVPIQQVKFYEDKSQLLTFSELLENQDEYLKYNVDFVPSNYNSESAYWVHYDFCIQSENHFVLEFFDQTIDRIDVMIKHESDSVYHSYHFGDQFVFNKRQFDHKNFQIVLNKPGQYYAYVRIVNQEYADIRVAIRSFDRFVDYALSEYYLYGIFYGMIIIISLYNLSIYSAIREVKYLYYTFYILSVGMFAMCVDGIAYQKLWPNMPEWNSIAHGVALFSIICWCIVFSKRFLNLKIRAPKTNQLLNIVFLMRALFFLYALTFDHSLFRLRFIEIFPLSVIFIGSIQTYKRGYKPARYFIVAYGFLFFGFVLKAMILFSVISPNWISKSYFLQTITYYSLHLCFVLEMLFLSLALSDRIRILKSNRDKAFRRIVVQHGENIKYKDKVNAQLEAKIKERTIEIAEKNQLLTHSNQELQNQKQEISKINSLLDLDNWRLKNDLKSVQIVRLINKKLSYDEFKEVFPHRDKCMKFLADSKWDNSYSCKKCGNQKYLRGTSQFAKRCTKCGYNETPTTDTVFHALKFPLQKAFYLVYLHLNNDHTPLNELSVLIDLRKNTVWSFKHKIQEFEEGNGVIRLNFFENISDRKK